MFSILSRINRPAFFVLVAYPVLLMSLFFYYTSHYELTLAALVWAVLGYYGSNISVGIGLHRLWSHNSYKAHPLVEWVLAVTSAGTLQGPIFAWASDHYRHHTYTDKDKDPHTPKKFQSPVLGFLWAHAGWMLFEKTPKHIDRVALVKLGRNKIVKWQLEHYWTLAAIMNIILPLTLGYLWGQTWYAALTAYLFIGIGRAIQQHFTFMVNSACHFWGKRPYYKGTARDIWWLALFLLGENWHNFHHAFPSDYRNGHKWYHFDVHKWIIVGLEKVGLAHSLERTEALRIQARIQDKRDFDVAARLEKLNSLTQKIQMLHQFLSSSPSLEDMKRNLKLSLEKKMSTWDAALVRWQQKAQSFEVVINKKSVERQLRDLEKRLKTLEHKMVSIWGHNVISGSTH